MGTISRFALRNPVVIVLMLVLVAGAGTYAAFTLRQEAFPDTSLPVVTVTTSYPGASAGVVLDGVTKPLEAALSGVSGVQALDSTSAEGLSRVVAQFDVGSDANALQRDVQDAVNGIALPTGALRPKVTVNGPSSRPIVTYSLVGADVAHLTDVAQNTVAPALQALDGVASVTVLGGATRDVLVTADPARLQRYGVSIAALDNAIASGTASQPVGEVGVGSVVEPLGAGTTLSNVAAIRALPIVPATAGLAAALGRTTGAGPAGPGGSSSGGSAAGTPLQQAAVYLVAARDDLAAYDPKGAATGPFGLGSGPTAVAQADIVAALADLGAHTADAVTEARAAELSLAGLAKQNSALFNNANFAGAVAWLSTANATLKLAGAGAPTLTVGDVASVTLGTPGVGAIVRTDGLPGVLVQVARTSSADTVQVAAAIRHTLAGLVLPRGVRVIKIYDASDTIASSVGGAGREGLLGILLAVIIIGLFLRNWRATLIAVVTIPVAFLLTLSCLNALGLTLNVITLAGFAVATGRVVDDSIVVIENLYRRIAAGEPITRPAVLAGVVDVGAAITSSTATTVCVFLPLAFVAGLVSTFFAPFAWTVTIALVSSYLAAITVVPLLAYVLFSRGHVAIERSEGGVTRAYRVALAWSLDHRAAVLGGTALTVLVALAILRATPTDLIPQTGPASAVVDVTAPPRTALQLTGAAAARVERVIGRDPDVASYYTTIGDLNQRSLFGTSSNVAQSNQGLIVVNFKDGVAGDEATNRLRALLDGRYGATVDVHKVGDANSALEVDVTGSNPADIRTVTRQVEAAVRAVGSVDNLADTLTTAQPELQVQVDPVRAARYGLTPAAVVTQLQALVNGVVAAHVTLDGASRDVVVALTSAALARPAALAALPLGAGGPTVALGQVATVQRTSGVVLITRHDQQLAARVTGSITSANVGGISGRIEGKVRALKLPGDTAVTLAGVSQQQNTAFGNLYNAMLVAVVLVFIVMVLAFRTLAAPVAILFALPVTLIGAAGGLLLGRQTLGLPALIGFLMLIGIVVTNAIVLMTRVQQFRAVGASTRTALLDAGANRLRPILMTAVATIGALLPLALGLAEGNLISQSLADSVIGGLVSSTVLTLVVVPVVFSLLVPGAPLPSMAARADDELIAGLRRRAEYADRAGAVWAHAPSTGQVASRGSQVVRRGRALGALSLPAAAAGAARAVLMRNGRLGRALRRRLRELIALAVALILVALALSRVFAHAAPGGAHGRALGPTFTRFTPIVGVPLPVTRVLALATGQSAPRAAAQLPNGKIAVVDTDTHRLVLLDPRDHATTSVGAGQMRQPDAIVVASGALYVLDAGRGAIERYDTSGRFVREIIHNAALVGATGMAVGPGGMLYVANPRTNSIIGLSVEGTIRRQITATRGPGADQLDGPSTVAVGAGGRLYVADSANNRIEELTPSGAYVAQWPAPRSDPRHPVSLLPRPDGRVLASDPAGGLLIYLPDSGLPAFLRALHLPPGQRPPVVPTGLASLADGTVLVTDGHGKRLLVVPVPR